MPKRMSCLLSRVIAEPGLSNFSVVGLGFATDFADVRFGLALLSPLFKSDVEVERLRGGFLEDTLSPAFDTSFKGTLTTVVGGWKRLLVMPAGSSMSLRGLYCSVAISVMVRAFFLGAFPFSGDEFRDFV